MGFTNSTRAKILIVEDDTFMQKILSTFLSKTYEVQVSDNGLDALSFLQDGNIPDLILTDLNTPKLNGFGLLDQIKSSDLFKSIPIIILSGEDASDKRTKGLNAGAEDFVAKPFNPTELEARIKVILRRVGK